MNYLNRRSFLKSSALFAGATLISPNLLSCQNPNSKLNIADTLDCLAIATSIGKL